VHVNRGLVFWGVAFVTAGAVALAIQSGILERETARQAWRLWPVVLIVIGVAVIASRTPFALIATLLAGLVLGGLGGTFVAGWPDGISVGCGGETDQRIGEDGSFDGSGSVALDFSCGELTVAMGDGSDWNVDARYASGARPELTSTDDSLRVAVEGDTVIFGLADDRQAWDVTLPTDADLDLEVSADAASSRLDLAGASLSGFDLQANAGEVHLDLSGAEAAGLEVDANAASVGITLDGDSAVVGSIHVNAGSVNLCVPDGAAIEIDMNDDNITFSHDLDDSDLVRSGDTWRGGDGTPAIRLDVEGNAASFSFNPDGGCS
jgi:hypothetical protein